MSDRDLLEERSPEELRYLKKHVQALRSDPEVQAAFDVHNKTPAAFTLGAFQNGVLIDGFPCRLTVGTLALLRATQARCMGYGEDTGPLSPEDITLAIFLLCDDTRNIAITVADDDDELNQALRKFSRQIHIKRAAIDLYEFLRRCGTALGEEEIEEEKNAEDVKEAIANTVFQGADDAWADDVDLLAHEYGWLDDYILWEIPLIRISRLKEAIVARRKGEPRTCRRGATCIALLKTIEKRGTELHNARK